MSVRITVFTPTYNRANTLGRLYRSLLDQSSQDFCWLVVDDGSTDQTEQMFEAWMHAGILDIRYYKQTNMGKPSAHNMGVELSDSELFMCIDSDDYLVSDAIEKILNVWDSSSGNVGVLAYKEKENNVHITQYKDTGINQGTLRDFYDNGLTGDTLLVFKTNIIKKYAFPIFEGEKFIPEAYLYDLIDREGKLLLLPEYLLVCEYRQDGYTANIFKLLYDNPNGYFRYINQRISFDRTIKHKVCDSIRYDAMAFAHKCTLSKCSRPICAYLVALPGYMLYLIRYKRYT